MSTQIPGQFLQEDELLQLLRKPPPHPQPTSYFKKFGSTNEPFLPAGKSGLTPLKTPVYPLTKEEWAFRRRLREYQLSHLDPFTSRELMLSDALGDPSVAPSDLKGVHQIFAQENWDNDLPRHLANYPLGHGRTGEFWRADNPDVWRVLQPVLALTTKFIENCHIWPWWDAIVSGERSGIQSRPLRSRFHARSPLESSSVEARIAIRDCINGLVDSPRPLRFTISYGACDPEHGLCAEGAWKALYIPIFLRKWNFARVHISYERLHILLFCDLTESERLMAQFELAISLYHELAHAVGSEVAPLDVDEPFYEDETVAELGHSMTNAVFGGRAFAYGQETRESYFHLRKQPPLGLIYQAGFPTSEDSEPREDCLDPYLIAGYGVSTEWAVPVKYVSDIQKEVFWTEHVTKYGLDALRPLPLGLGVEKIKMPGMIPTSRNTTLDPRSDIGLPGEMVRRAHERNAALWSDVSKTFGEDEIFNEEEYLRLYGGEAHFLTVNEVDEVFDSSMPCTDRITEIADLLNYHQVDLALDTMVEWTPANLVLDYIHRLLPGQVSPEDFEEFLTYCQCHKQLFEYRRRGSGEVRRIPTGWEALPPKTKVSKPRGYGEFLTKISKFKGQAFMVSRSLHDLDVDLFFERLSHLIRQGGGTPMDRETFNRGLAYLDYKNKFFVLGPPGIIRWVRKSKSTLGPSDAEEETPEDSFLRNEG